MPVTARTKMFICFSCRGGGQRAKMWTLISLDFNQHISDILVLFFHLGGPAKVGERIFVSTVDVAILVNPLVHFANVFNHLSCVSLKEPPYSADKQRISSESARLRIKNSDRLALYCGLIDGKALLFKLLRKEAINGVSLCVAGNMQSLHPAFADLQLLIFSQGIVCALHEVSIFLADDHSHVGTVALCELVVEVKRAASMIPVFVGV